MASQNIQRAIVLLDHWRRRARVLQKLHYDRAEFYHRKNVSLGVPVAVLAGLTGTSVLVSVAEPLGAYAKIVVGLLSLVAATLSIIQTSLKFDERAQKHRSAAVGYGTMNRALERVQALPPTSDEGAQILLERFEEQLNQLAQHVPSIPRSVFVNAAGDESPGSSAIGATPAGDLDVATLFEANELARPIGQRPPAGS